MDSPYSPPEFAPLEFTLLNDWQRGFPLTARPFRVLGDKTGASEAAVLATLARLSACRAISRVGAIIAPGRIGASTLAALAAPEARLDDIAARVSAYPAVNHNYRREHAYNLWFVVTRPDAAALAATLAAISRETGCEVLNLPLEREYHIDLGFDLHHAHKHRAAYCADLPARPLDADDRALLAALEPGLDLVPRPFERLAALAGLDEADVLARLDNWMEEGLLKRFGVIVRHRELGFRANAMVVFDVPDAAADALGERLAQEPGVTLCYRRRRSLPDWPYNLYCMVHGRSREEVHPVIERLSAIAGRTGLPLFSTQRYKQCGARYFSSTRADHESIRVGA